LTCTCASQWASAEIFSGEQKRHFAYQFVAADATQIDINKMLYPFYTIKKMPNATATVANSVPSKKIYTDKCLF